MKIMIKFIFSLLMVFIFFTCKKESNNNVNNKLNFDEIIKNFDGYPIIIKKSPNNNYIFVTTYAAENDDKYEESTLKNELNIDGFQFKKGENNWWFLYNNKENKMIFKDSELLLIGSVGWLENPDYFYFNYGTSPGRSIELYDLSNLNNIIKINFNSIDEDVTKNYKFNKKNTYFAFINTIQSDDMTEVPIKNIIKIKDISNGNDIVINPDNENNTLEIIDWNTDVSLKYFEIEQDTQTKIEKNYEIK